MNKALLFLFCLSVSCPLWGMQEDEYFWMDPDELLAYELDQEETIARLSRLGVERGYIADDERSDISDDLPFYEDEWSEKRYEETLQVITNLRYHLQRSNDEYVVYDMKEDIAARLYERFCDRGGDSSVKLHISFEDPYDDYPSYINWLEDVTSGEISLEEPVAKLLAASQEHIDINEFEIVLLPSEFDD